jgi:DNA-binding response OmpR family regulator
MTNHKILLVDDDRDVLEMLLSIFRRAGYTNLRTAASGAEALRIWQEEQPSLIVLDVMMPDMNGFQVLQKIREKNNVPVLMLTAKSDEEDKVSGLRLGADDYLTKPFGISELMARVNSLIRRYTTLNPVTGNEAATMLLKDMVIDKINRTVTVQNLPVDLTGKEFDLLLFLASNKGRVFTKKQLYMQVWTEEYDFDDNNLMAFISKLRKKIEPNPEQPFYIQTVRGVGYRFNKEA